MRKIAWVLAVVLCVSCFGGCAKKSEIQKEVGCFTQLGVDEATLNAATKETFFKLVPFAGLKYFDNLNSMVLALNSGQIGAMEANEFSAEYLMAKNDNYSIYVPDTVPVYQMYFSMLLREEDEVLRDKITASISEMKQDGTLDTLKRDYIDACVTGKQPEPVKPEQFEGAETVRFAVTGDLPPMDFFDESGVPAGFNTALISEIGKRLKVNVEFVSIDSGARALSLTSKESDVVFWMGNANYDDWEGGTSQDQPAGTIATEPYISTDIKYVILKTSTLSQK